MLGVQFLVLSVLCWKSLTLWLLGVNDPKLFRMEMIRVGMQIFFVWVFFLWTWCIIEQSSFLEIGTSRKGMLLSFSTSIMNCMLSFWLLKWSKNLWRLSSPWDQTTSVSSTKIPIEEPIKTIRNFTDDNKVEFFKVFLCSTYFTFQNQWEESMGIINGGLVKFHDEFYVVILIIEVVEESMEVIYRINPSALKSTHGVYLWVFLAR